MCVKYVDGKCVCSISVMKRIVVKGWHRYTFQLWACRLYTVDIIYDSVSSTGSLYSGSEVS